MQCPMCNYVLAASDAECPRCGGRKTPQTTVLKPREGTASAPGSTLPVTPVAASTRPTAQSPWDSTHPTARPLSTPVTAVPPPLPSAPSGSRFKTAYVAGGLALSVLVGLFGYLGRPVERTEGGTETTSPPIPAPGGVEPNGMASQSPAGNAASSAQPFQAPTPSPQANAQAEQRHHLFIVQVLTAWEAEIYEMDYAISLTRLDGNRQRLVNAIEAAAADFDKLLEEFDRVDIPPRLATSHAFFRRAVYQGRDSFRQMRSYADTLNESEASQAHKSMQDALTKAKEGIDLEVQTMSQ